MLKKATLAALVLVGLPMQAHAGDGTVRLDAHMSTLGTGLELGTALSESYSVRAGFNQYSFNYNDTSGGQTFDGKLKWSSVAALLDWRPWGGTTHLTLGAVFNNNKIEANGTVANGSTYTADNVNYTCASAGCGIGFSVGFNKVAPYLGIGWSGHPKKQGFSFSSDFGIMFQGSPQATVTSLGTWNVGGTPVTTSVLDADAQNEINKELDGLKYYPVISIGVGYAF